MLLFGHKRLLVHHCVGTSFKTCCLFLPFQVFFKLQEKRACPVPGRKRHLPVTQTSTPYTGKAMLTFQIISIENYIKAKKWCLLLPDSCFAKHSLKKVSGVHYRLHMRKAGYYLCVNKLLEILSKGIQLHKAAA